MAFNMKKKFTATGLQDSGAGGDGIHKSNSPFLSKSPMREDKDPAGILLPEVKVGGAKEETTEEYNARVMAEYEEKLQAHSDSTAAYNQAVIIDDLYNKGIDTKTKGTKKLLGKMKELKTRQEYYKKNTSVWNSEGELISGAGEDFIDPGYDDPGCGKGFMAGAHGECVEATMKGVELIKEGKALDDELKKTGIYPTGKRKLKRGALLDYFYENTAEQVKPGRVPIKPTTMAGMIKIKNLEVKDALTEVELKKAPPYELVKNNSEYFTTEMKGKRGGSYIKGEDGKSEINLRDQAGRIVWEGSQTEFTEKYGEHLAPGSKEYGPTDRKGRFYLNK